MARCRGSSRRAPSPRSSKKRVTRSMNNIDKSYKFDMDSIPIKQHISSDYPSERPQKKTRVTLPLPDRCAVGHGESEKKETGSDNKDAAATAEIPRKDLPIATTTRQRVPGVLAGSGTSFSRLEQTDKTSLVTRTHSELPSRNLEQDFENLPPAPFEVNEVRRAQKYKREQRRMDEVHDRALAQSMSRGTTLLDRWEDSKHVSFPTKKSNTSVKNTPHQLPLKGEGRELSLSPVFPIAPANPDTEIDLLDLDGRASWPIDADMPEPRISIPPLSHVPPQTVDRPRTDLCLTPQFHERSGPPTLREQYLARQSRLARQTQDTMTLEEMSLFVDFDAER